MSPLSHTDLILNPDGSVYHLQLRPEDIADTILLVGDPGRVGQVSSHFDSVELKKQNREFVTVTGRCGKKRITVLSTGIGPDNVEIVMNELDALVNVDLEERRVSQSHKKLKLIRLGTSGALLAEIEPGAAIMAEVAGGFDGLYHFYHDPAGVTVPGLAEAFIHFTGWKEKLPEPYFISASTMLLDHFAGIAHHAGITLSTPGFYAPQSRSIRLETMDPKMIQKIGSFSFNGMRINNFEMESSVLYALSALLQHEAVTLCVAIANRITGNFLEDYHPAVDKLISNVLDRLTADESA